MKPTARRHARQYALQAMYQWQLSHAPIKEIELDFLVHHIKQKTDLVYFKELIHNIPAEQIELDNQFIPFLSRPIAELDPVELAILRLGTYELSKRLDIPYRVAINEALELTKRFGSIEGYKFVNGVLDQLARKLRIEEINADKKS
jgi:N utilization substance protein B